MYHYYAYYYGVEYEYLLSAYGITEKDFAEQAKSIALSYMTMYAFVSKYDLEISEQTLEEIQEEYIQDAMESNAWEYDEAKTYVLENEVNTIHSAAVQKTVLAWIVSQNTAD